jgi:hypothetical protein
MDDTDTTHSNDIKTPASAPKAKELFSLDKFAKAYENNATIEQIEKHYTLTDPIKQAWFYYVIDNDRKKL